MEPEDPVDAAHVSQMTDGWWGFRRLQHDHVRSDRRLSTTVGSCGVNASMRLCWRCLRLGTSRTWAFVRDVLSQRCARFSMFAIVRGQHLLATPRDKTGLGTALYLLWLMSVMLSSPVSISSTSSCSSCDPPNNASHVQLTTSVV